MNTHEVLNPTVLHPESPEDLIARMQGTMSFVQRDAQAEPSLFNIDLAKRVDNGTDVWALAIRKPLASESVNTSDPQAPALFEAAISSLQESPEIWDRIARAYQWWDKDIHNIKEDGETRAVEYFEVGDEDRYVGLLNCTNEALSEEETERVQTAVQAVAKLTNGKIFDRVAGIMLCQADRFGEEVGADFGAGTRIVRINMDEVRNYTNNLNNRYTPYLGKHGRLEVYIAHELGHAMDIDSYDEIQAAELNTDQVTNRGLSGMSAFDGKFGWDYRPGPEEVKKDAKWVINPALQIECREEALTGYAQMSPQEDFAETFALMALEGDTGSVDQRVKTVLKTIADVEGSSSPQDATVTVSKKSANGTFKPTIDSGFAVRLHIFKGFGVVSK